MPPVKTNLTVKERLDAIAASGHKLAFDGCHKLYFLDCEEAVQEARDIGYEIHESTEVHDLYALDRCGLRFVSRWGLDRDPASWESPLNIGQFEED